MPTITNVSPIGDLDVPALRRVVKAGEAVEVTVDIARSMLDQPTNWAPFDDEARGIVAELTAVDDVDAPPADDEPVAGTATRTRKAAK